MKLSLGAAVLAAAAVRGKPRGPGFVSSSLGAAVLAAAAAVRGKPENQGS